MNHRRIWWLGVLVLLVLPVFLRWPTLPGNWSLDEANTGLFAEHVRNGDVLYRDVVDNRTPLLVYILAAETFIIGHWNLPGQHLVQAVLIGLCALLLWRTLARLGASGAGAWSAGIFSLLQFIYLHPLDAYGITVEWYLVLFSALAFWLLAVAWTGARTWLAFVAGLCFGCSYLAKQPGLIDLVSGLVWIAIFVAFEPADRRRRLATAALLVAGFATAVGGSILYFAANGAWENYRFYAWTYNTRYYLPDVTSAQRWQAMHYPIRFAWTAVPVFLVYASVALVLLLPGLGRSTRQRLKGQEVPLLILGWTASGILGSGLSGREYGHYSIQLLPGFSLLCGWLCHAAWQYARRLPISWSRRIAFGAIALLPIVLGTTQAFQRRAAVVLPKDPARKISELVRANTTPAERVFTWGYYPEISYFAERLSSTRFAYSVFLTGMIPWTNVAYDIDTTYAIVPGSWDQFWQDVERKPPALIVDTRTARTFAKYPLSRQSRLWEYIQKNYLEIEVGTTRPLGCRIYRRVGAPLADAPPAAGDPALALEEMVIDGVHSGVMDAWLPRGIQAAEFVVNGKGTGAVSLDAGTTHQLTFQYLPLLHGKNLSVCVRVRRADGTLADGPVLALAENELTHTPDLMVGDVPFRAVSMESLATVVWLPQQNAFSVHAPGRLVYDRPAVIRSIEFTYGVLDGAFMAPQTVRTDGVEYQVSFQPEHGASQRLFTRMLDPLRVAEDRGPQRVKIDLPENQSGRLTIVISPGPRSDPSSDWTYISNLSADAPPLLLEYGINQYLAVGGDTPFGFSPVVVNSRRMVHAHAPATVEFPLEPDMREVSGQFGMMDNSWNTSQGQTAGLDFIAEQVAPDGKVTELWRRRLDPGHQASDRGIQDYHIKLATPVAGRLRLKAQPAHPPDNSFGYAFWSNLTAR